MFTGIIEEMGEVVSLTPTDAGSAVLTLRAGTVLNGLPDGGSLAVNGVCLTQAPESLPSDGAARSLTTGVFVAHVMGETLTRTTVGGLQSGDPVNLERCPRASDRLDGHIVQGHVDGTGRVLARVDEGDWVTLRISVPADLAPYTAEKGSIALDGISLTLSAVSPAPGGEPTARPATASGAGPSVAEPSDSAQPDPGHWVEVSLIPATLAATRMGVLAVGDEVNIEVDVIAKYAARLTQFQAAAHGTSAHRTSDPAHEAAPTNEATPAHEGDLT